MCSGIFAHLDSFISESIGIISIRENYTNCIIELYFAFVCIIRILIFACLRLQQGGIIDLGLWTFENCGAQSVRQGSDVHRARLSCVCLSWIEINSRTRADWWDVYQAAWITNEQLGVRQPCLNIRQILAKTASEWSWTPLPSLLTYYPHWLPWRRPDKFRSYDMAFSDKGDHTSQGPKIFRFWNIRENLIPKTAKLWRPKIGSALWSVVWLCTFVSYLGQHGPAYSGSPTHLLLEPTSTSKWGGEPV